MATVGELSKKFSAQLSQLQAIFPTWDEQDLVFALQDVKGNVEEAVLAISEGRASQFTQATKKKGPKSSAPSKSRNDGWESTESFSGGRGGRSAGATRGGRGGASAGRGAPALRGVRIGRGGARGGGRGGYGNVNGANKKQNGAPSDAWPTTTATTAEGWSNQVQQSEAASAHEDDGGWGDAPETKTTATTVDDGGWGEPAPAAEEKTIKSVNMGVWGKPRPPPGQKEAPKPAQQAPKEVPKEAPKEEAPKEEAAPAPAAPAAPAAKPKMTWAQIAKPPEKPKPTPPPAPKAPEPKPEPVAAPEPEAAKDEPEAVPEPVEEEKVEEEVAAPEEPEPEPEPDVEEEIVVVVEETKVEEVAAPEEPAPAPVAETQEAWASDPAIVGSAAPAAPVAEPVTTYTGPPGFNNVPAAKAIGSQTSRTNSRAAQRYKNADGQAVVLPASASGVAQVEVQFGSLSFGGLNGDGVEAPVPETPAAQEPVATSPVRSTAPLTSAPAAPAAAAPVAPAAAPAAAPAPAPVAAAPAAPSGWPQQQQQQAPQQPAGYPPSQTLQQQMQAYQSYGQQPQQVQPVTQDAAPQQPQQAAPQQQQQPQQSQYGYRQQDYYNPIGSQSQVQQPESQPAQQQAQPQAQQQPQQQHSYDAAPFGGFGSHQGWPNQHAAQQNDYGHRAFDSYSSYPRPPADEPKQAAPAPSHTSGPAQPQQNLPHQQNQYYSALGNMGYYHSGPYNPYYQYGQAPNPGFQQYYPMAGRNLYGQPAPQAPPAPIPNKPTPPATHYGQPSYPSSSGFDDQSFGGLGRYGETKAAVAPQTGAGAQGQQNPQPIGSTQSYPSQQGLHNFLGGPGSTSAQPNRPQTGTPDDSFKAQGAGANAASAQGAGARAQPQQPQAQQAFASYPYGGYQNHDWSPYSQQHYGGSRNGGYSGWQQ